METIERLIQREICVLEVQLVHQECDTFDNADPDAEERVFFESYF